MTNESKTPTNEPPRDVAREFQTMREIRFWLDGHYKDAESRLVRFRNLLTVGLGLFVVFGLGLGFVAYQSINTRTRAAEIRFGKLLEEINAQEARLADLAQAAGKSRTDADNAIAAAEKLQSDPKAASEVIGLINRLANGDGTSPGLVTRIRELETEMQKLQERVASASSDVQVM